MKELILLKSGEIALKGLNRSMFENVLMKNARHVLDDIGNFKIYKAQSTFYAEPLEECDLDAAMDRLSKVFGFAALTRAHVVDKDMDVIKTFTVEYLSDVLNDVRTFKVEAKRADKSFPLNSPAISRELGGYILEEFPHLKVDVHSPDVVVTVEVRDFGAYLHAGQTVAAGGLPISTGGNGALLLSGGIDSPVAGYMMAKRGLRITCIHFASPPYTSPRAQQKVETLAAKMVPWCGIMRVYIVPFTAIQEAINENCPEAYFTIIMRRYMMRIASVIAEKNDCKALITGESVGQVASQTLEALACTDQSSALPVLRPLVGMDKTEIVAVSKHIDTFETSILPYEDCCTVFTPRRPKTKPRIEDILEIEESLQLDELVAKAINESSYILAHRER